MQIELQKKIKKSLNCTEWYISMTKFFVDTIISSERLNPMIYLRDVCLLNYGCFFEKRLKGWQLFPIQKIIANLCKLTHIYEKSMMKNKQTKNIHIRDDIRP